MTALSSKPGRRERADLELARKINLELPLIREGVSALVRRRLVKETDDLHCDLLRAVELLQEAAARLVLKATKPKPHDEPAADHS